jgi:hypothetical protein
MGSSGCHGWRTLSIALRQKLACQCETDQKIFSFFIPQPYFFTRFLPPPPSFFTFLSLHSGIVVPAEVNGDEAFVRGKAWFK